MECFADTAEVQALTWIVTCPGCHFRGQVPGTYRGRRVRCRSCSAQFVVSHETSWPGALVATHDGIRSTAEMPAYRRPTASGVAVALAGR